MNSDEAHCAAQQFEFNRFTTSSKRPQLKHMEVAMPGTIRPGCSVDLDLFSALAHTFNSDVVGGKCQAAERAPYLLVV